MVPLLVGCEVFAFAAMDLGEEEVLVDRVWNVDAYRVHEHVLRRPTFHDPVVDRTYRVWNDGGWTDLGVLGGESETGIADSASPQVVHDHLAVFVGSDTLIYTPHGNVWRAIPHEAQGYERERHDDYELRAERLSLRDGRWTIDMRIPRPEGDVTYQLEGRGEHWQVVDTN